MADLDPTTTPGEPDPIFEPSERLYRRIPWADVENRFVSDVSLPSPAFSVNREKYMADATDLFEFGVEHMPEPGNYSHSEVHTYKGGLRLDDKPPRQVRKKFRDALRKGIVILDLEMVG
jgi:hypothetical protein